MIYGSQIFQLDAGTLEIKEEILLELEIEAFSYEKNTLNLKLAGLTNTTNKIDDHHIMESNNYCSNESVEELLTVTCKTCTWSFDCPHLTFSLKFPTKDNSGLSCTPSNAVIHRKHGPIKEVIKDDHVAIILDNKLQILQKTSNRPKITSAPLIHKDFPVQSLIWIDESILVFTVLDDNKLNVTKYHLMQFAPPTNGYNWPLVAWSGESINVHRAGAICSAWYNKLKNSQVWDVLDSPVGLVQNVQVSADGSCLLVCGQTGVSFCDFFSRTWHNLSFKSLLFPKWLGNDHVIALTPDTKELILISRTNETLKITIQNSDQIQFIDTYNNWQLIIQKNDEIQIFAFDSESKSFALCDPLNTFSCSSQLIQAAYFKGNLFLINKEEDFIVNNEIKENKCKHFLVLSSGHLLLVKGDFVCLWKDEEIHSIKNRPISVLPFLNCLTTLHLDEEAPSFSLSMTIKSKFLLSDLFFASSPAAESVRLLLQWSQDPLYQLALEYILLKSIGKPEILDLIDSFHAEKTKTLEITFSKALVSLTRKVDVDAASQKLFPHLRSFSPTRLVQTLCESKSFDDVINFLPYLAKSRDKDAIVLILEMMLNRAIQFNDQIGKVKEFLSAFEGLEDLFKETINRKIETLWNNNRQLKAYSLMKYTDSENLNLNFSVRSSEDYFQIEAALYPELVSKFKSWLTHK